MKVYIQNEKKPNQVLYAFDDVVNRETNRLRWAVAYSTRKGCERLVERVSSQMSEDNWQSSEKTFLVSIDFGFTEPAALKFLSQIENSRVLIANAHLLDGSNLFPENAFHPKLYMFDSDLETGIVTGSANLTKSAFLHNTEVVVTGIERRGHSSWDHQWHLLEASGVLLEDQLLQKYSALRRRTRPIHSPERSVPRVRIHPDNFRIFWDAIEDNPNLAGRHGYFWIEAGSMSSGGSHNQLELPRGANRFFGFAFSDYRSAHRIIGHPTLTIKDNSWSDRKLTWHGNNRMERINLPTRAQGGFEYQDTAILFRRHSDEYQIEVRSWNDDVAITWRGASKKLQTVFRLGERGPRVCGLF